MGLMGQDPGIWGTSEAYQELYGRRPSDNPFANMSGSGRTSTASGSGNHWSDEYRDPYHNYMMMSSSTFRGFYGLDDGYGGTNYQRAGALVGSFSASGSSEAISYSIGVNGAGDGNGNIIPGTEEFIVYVDPKGGMQYASFGAGDFITSGQLAIAALEPSFRAAAYEAFRTGGRGNVPLWLKKNIFKSYRAVNNNALSFGKINAGFARNGAAVLKFAAPALTVAAIGTNLYDIGKDGTLTWGDAFVATNTTLQIAFPVYGFIYGAADVGTSFVFGKSITGFTKDYIDSNTSGSIKMF